MPKTITLITLSAITATSLLVSGCKPVKIRPSQPLPDLVNTISAPQTSNRSIPVTVHESNQGSLLARDHVIRVYLRSQTHTYSLRGGSFNTVALAAGQSRSFRLNLWAPPHIRSGSYDLCASTDTRNDVHESREHNNTDCRRIWINNGPANPAPAAPRTRRPDLAISILAPHRSNRTIPVTVRDTNQGRRRGADYHLIRVYLRKNGRTIPLRGGRIRASRLQAGQTHQYRIQAIAPPALPWGRYRLCATSDTRNQVRESNEHNNTSCRPIILTSSHETPPAPRHQPDLTAHISAPRYASRQIPVTVRDSNLGNRPAMAHRIRIYLRKNGGIITLRGGSISAANLRVRDFRIYRTTVIVPAIRNGHYRLCATTDDGNYIRERNERNNTSCRPIEIRNHR